jgi:hypothetical protein
VAWPIAIQTFLVNQPAGLLKCQIEGYSRKPGIVNGIAVAGLKNIQALRLDPQTGFSKGWNWSWMEGRHLARKGQTWRGLPFYCQAKYWPHTALTLTKLAGALQALSF